MGQMLGGGRQHTIRIHYPLQGILIHHRDESLLAKGKVKIWISEKQDRDFQYTTPGKYENVPDTFTLR